VDHLQEEKEERGALVSLRGDKANVIGGIMQSAL